MAEAIKAMFDGLLDPRMLLLLAAIFGYLIQKSAKATRALAQSSDQKLDTVVAQGDGLRTEMLQKIAALERMLSTQSGNTLRADNAQQAADASAAKSAAKEK